MAIVKAGYFGPDEGDYKIADDIVYQFDYIEVDDMRERLEWVAVCHINDAHIFAPGLIN